VTYQFSKLNITSQTDKPYELSPFVKTLWKKAIKQVDPQLKGNYHKGAVWECFDTLLFERAINELGLQDKIQVLSNPYDRKYKSRKGNGIDIMITWKKPNGNRVPIIYVECKDWQPRYLSPKVFYSHIHQRFWNIITGQKLIISRGIRYSITTLNKLVDHGYKIVTHNYYEKIKQLIINKTKKYNTPTNYTPTNNKNIIKSVPVHMTSRPPTPIRLFLSII
jgi:hypothetical protein